MLGKTCVSGIVPKPEGCRVGHEWTNIVPIFKGGAKMNLSDIMTTEVITCDPNETIFQVAQKLQQNNIGSCPVVQNDQILGIVTDRDITTRAVAKGFDVNSRKISEIMTSNPFTGDPSMSLEEACDLMSERQIRRLPIVEENKLVGIVALADLAIDLDEEEVVAETLLNISQPTG